MANTKYSDLLQHILPEFAGCSSMLAESQVRASVIEFCRRSRVWRIQADPITAAIGIDAYDLELPLGASPVQIDSMEFAGEALTPADTLGQWVAPGAPKVYSQITPDSFSLQPPPDTEGAITMTMTIAPSRASTAFPSWIADRYQDGIVAGAKSRLLGMMGNPWTNLQAAGLQRRIFDDEVRAACGDARTSLTRAVQRTQSHH